MAVLIPASQQISRVKPDQAPNTNIAARRYARASPFQEVDVQAVEIGIGCLLWPIRLFVGRQFAMSAPDHQRTNADVLPQVRLGSVAEVLNGSTPRPLFT